MGKLGVWNVLEYESLVEGKIDGVYVYLQQRLLLDRSLIARPIVIKNDDDSTGPAPRKHYDFMSLRGLRDVQYFDIPYLGSGLVVYCVRRWMWYYSVSAAMFSNRQLLSRGMDLLGTTSSERAI